MQHSLPVLVFTLPRSRDNIFSLMGLCRTRRCAQRAEFKKKLSDHTHLLNIQTIAYLCPSLAIGASKLWIYSRVFNINLILNMEVKGMGGILRRKLGKRK